MSPIIQRNAMAALRRAPISRARTRFRSRNREHPMRTVVTLLEWSIGAACAIAIAAYVGHGALLIANLAA